MSIARRTCRDSNHRTAGVSMFPRTAHEMSPYAYEKLWEIAAGPRDLQRSQQKARS